MTTLNKYYTLDRDALVVVHIGIPYFTLEGRTPKVARQTWRLFEWISSEVGRYVENGKRVYYLDGEDSPNTLNHPSIRSYAQHIVYIPEDIFELQTLRTKELLMNDGVESVTLAGVAHNLCVTDIHCLLLGENSPNYYPDDAKTFYEEASRDLGWPSEKFESVYHKRLDTHINESLTDKIFISRNRRNQNTN